MASYYERGSSFIPHSPWPDKPAYLLAYKPRYNIFLSYKTSHTNQHSNPSFLFFFRIEYLFLKRSFLSVPSCERKNTQDVGRWERAQPTIGADESRRGTEQMAQLVTSRQPSNVERHRRAAGGPKATARRCPGRAPTHRWRARHTRPSRPHRTVLAKRLLGSGD